MKKSILSLALSISIIGGTSLVLSAQENGEPYTIKKGDSISKLAEKYYGSVLKYQVIVNATNDKALKDSSYTHIKNPDVVTVGQVLWIPSVTSSGSNLPLFSLKADKKTIHFFGKNETSLAVVDDGIEIKSFFKKIPISSGSTGGAFFIIEDEGKVTGERIKIEVDASVKNLTPGQQMGMAYSTAAVGNSGWHFVDLREGKNTYSFIYNVPFDAKIKQGSGADYLGIISDKRGNGRGVIVHEARVFLQ